MARLIGSISHLSVEEAAAELKTTNTRILMLLREQALKGKQLDGEWYVESDSVACTRTDGTDMKVAKGCIGHCFSGCGCK